MAEERFLVTGGLGCLGAWVVNRLLDEDVAVHVYDLPGGSLHRLRLVVGEQALGRVTLLHGDVTDAASLEDAVLRYGVTHVVHLAALQVPFVRADPVRGAQVNVVGTTVVFETVRRNVAQVRGLSYASSLGVYGPPDHYPPGPLGHDAPPDPRNLYGVFKRANDELARVYWDDWSVPSVGLRPAVVYGPGRDQGWTSLPTKAMLAAAADLPYHVAFGGDVLLQHADDVAAAFVRAARTSGQGAAVYNLGGTTVAIPDLIEAVAAAVPGSRGRITYDPQPLPVPAEVDDRPLSAALGPLRWRPISDGVRDTIERFRVAVAKGLVDVDAVLAT